MSTRSRTLRLGTRGSDLALRQAAAVKERLERRRQTVELVEVETTGDRIDDELIHRLGKTGAFVRDLDEEVLAGEIDAAVHSMKDVPTEMPDELVVAGVPERAVAGDVLVTPDGASLAALPEGSTVGTSSLRRRAQLLADRSDLEVVPLRGNVDTRVEKLLGPSLQREHERRLEAEGAFEPDLPADEANADVTIEDVNGNGKSANGESADGGDSDEDDADGGDADEDDADSGDADVGDTNADEDTGFDRTAEEWFDDLAEIERRALERDVGTEYNAIVLAEAGLERSGLLHHVAHERLPTTQFVPAPGQGTLAVTAADEDVVAAVREAVDRPHTRVEATVERTVLAELGGGCIAPVGIYAVLQGPVVRTTVRVLDRDGEESVAESRDLPVERHREAARAFASDLADRGAADLIERARKRAEEEA
ncbi:hydroxymethylbilane synthase [Halobacteriales archaeon SW_7_68_16]|nr:MAG: hydroxymethylbilane synthase [Halobacteriales archaeon SW_7_68_16]